MWDLLLRSKRLPIAIDIGSDSIRMLQMRKSGGVLAALACARWRFPDSADAASPEGRSLAVAAVREMLREGGFRGRSVISALSCEQLAIKSVRLPQLPEEELADAIQWEAKERFGFEVEPGQLSYIRAGLVRQGTETREEIILLAAPPGTVDAHLELLGEMGLTAEHIEAQPVALFRVLERFLRRGADSEAVSVILDLGRAAVRVVVARGRRIVFIKSIDMGGRKVTEAVAKQLDLTVREAEDLRMQVAQEHVDASAAPAPDTPPPQRDASSLNWTVRDAVRAKLEALAREVALCLRYCVVTFRGLRARQATLTGGGAYDPAIAEILKEHLKIESVMGEPFRGIDLSAVDFGSDRRAVLAEWAGCCGLAIRDVDMPEAEQGAENGHRRLSA